MSSEGTPVSQDQVPNLQVMAQYIKDLSFENPGVAMELTQRPQIELSVDLNAKKLEAELFEVELKIRVDAKNDGKALFLLEVAYAGVFRLTNVPDTATQQANPADPGAAHAVPPSCARVVADIVRDGGMPPLMIEPIDFMALYQARVAQAAGAPTAGTA